MHCHEGNWYLSLQLLQQMRSAGPQPTMINYNAAIGVCSRHKQWRDAARVLLLLQADGLRPDVVSYTAAIKSCEGQGQDAAEQARTLWQQLQQSGLVLDTRSYGAFFRVCDARADFWQHAAEARAAMAQQGLQFDKECELAFIHVCKRACHEPAALQHLLQLRADGCSYSASEHSARVAALHACRAQGRWELAVQLLSEVQQPEYPHYRCAICACADSGV
jgi:pentatricopeptide repeat domain-containing protein 1